MDSKSCDQASQTLVYNTTPRPYYLVALPWSLTQFLTDFSQILDSKSYDQA